MDFPSKNPVPQCRSCEGTGSADQVQCCVWSPQNCVWFIMVPHKLLLSDPVAITLEETDEDSI